MALLLKSVGVLCNNRHTSFTWYNLVPVRFIHVSTNKIIKESTSSSLGDQLFSCIKVSFQDLEYMRMNRQRYQSMMDICQKPVLQLQSRLFLQTFKCFLVIPLPKMFQAKPNDFCFSKLPRLSIF